LWPFALRCVASISVLYGGVSLACSANTLHCHSDSEKCFVWRPLRDAEQSRHVRNLKILRSQRDEASLALFFGKITSLLVHVAGSISIVVPIAAVLLAALFLCYVIDISLSQYHRYQDCVANGKTQIQRVVRTKFLAPASLD
jgi:hypothetical protein